ncbi:SdpI family protein [Lacticaseibacillus daqingensis]|uniref:SdpI family protein n=1 Tax=Lacticaseibacillus daqingensis TaxID=2486014 RepID=UPI000F788E83|nr:SdpI family protein [Lacticaseibacillus daqingensis]
MILMGAGAVQFAIGLVLWVFPPRRISGFYGYSSYLASISDAGYQKAQVWARHALLVTGALEAAAGVLIRWGGLDRLFILWLLVAAFLFLPMFIYTEGKLKAYLVATDQLPADYVDPDDALKQKSQSRHYETGLRDRLKK